jgi:hypothetical protein
MHTSIGYIYLQNGMAFMNDFLLIYSYYEYIVYGNDGVQVSYLFHDNHERIG